MALFGTKKNTVEKKKVEKKAQKKLDVTAHPVNSSVIIRPYITEKAGLLAEKRVYTFEVAPSANKVTIAQAIASIYKVVPVKIAIVTIKPHTRMFKNRIQGKTAGAKKAYVYLKEGDTIDFI
ncbi:MAG TPA: 50S ribosomal protein L23 [Candidatus Paceibacterota bacterium]|jgi:large subunit ribosomal protein L23|nr:50S ribosomal protein L23 [Candidatus Paceibacterota bacterium]